MGGADREKWLAVLRENSARGVLVEKLGDGAVRCTACAHRCRLPAGKAGICNVRFNEGGELLVPRGYVAALQCDPIEKKPFFHVRPGARTLSFGMIGCDLHCGYCQNWGTSQILRDPEAAASLRRVGAEQIVDLALAQDAEIVTSTYNEPLITSEWAVEVFRVAKACGLSTSFVSNGNATPEVLEYLRPWVDFYKVDLKSFSDRHYRELGGKLQTVLDAIRGLVERGYWVEVVTLIVPGLNDGDAELAQIARFLASVSADIPWHVTAFHPEYKMADVGWTPAESCWRAVRIGREAGLNFVYAGNLPGRVGELESTRCARCDTVLIERRGFRVLRIHLDAGRCPSCGAEIPGVWGEPNRKPRFSDGPIPVRLN